MARHVNSKECSAWLLSRVNRTMLRYREAYDA